MKSFLFTYGNIVVKEMTQSIGLEFEPNKSVFIKGYKLKVEHANDENYPDYHYILCEHTDNQEDIIPGFIVEATERELFILDNWEGESYKRVEIVCYTRNLEEVKCFIYLKNNSAA